MQFAEHLGANQLDYKVNLNLPKVSETISKRLQKPYFLITPFSSKIEKDWRIENYIDIIAYVKSKYKLDAVIAASLKDYEAIEELSNSCGALNLAGKTNLKDLAVLIQNAEFLLSPDTGPMHIASYLGTKVVSLFATTSSKITGPYFDRSYVVDKHDEALQNFGSLQDKKLQWNVRVYHLGSMKLISKDEVISKIEACLSKD